jgi:UDP-sugar transporter A1/2/3
MAVSTRRSSRASLDSSAGTGAVFCVLLALQYALQPFLKVCIAPETHKVSLVLGTEVAKILIAGAMIAVDGPGAFARTFANWTPKAASLSVLPSLVYAVQNYLLVVGASSLDSVTFNCLNQSKLVSTALCVYFVFGVRQSLTQTLALGGLLVAGAILQEGGGVASGAEKDADQTRAKVAGVAAVLAASALSGVASAATQFSLQRLRRTSTALTVEMAVAAIPCLLLAHYGASDLSDRGGFFRGWTASTLIPVVSSALGGIFVGQITKRLGGVAKGFAIVGGLVLTGILQSLVTGEGLEAKHAVALLLVVSCTYAHASFPPASAKTRRKKKQR